MADVFISYRNTPDRRTIVRRLATILRAHEVSVWWDYGLEAGESYRAQIMIELANARIVAPLWCAESVASRWVRMEAELGKDKLVPARLQESRAARRLRGHPGRRPDRLGRRCRQPAFAGLCAPHLRAASARLVGPRRHDRGVGQSAVSATAACNRASRRSVCPTGQSRSRLCVLGASVGEARRWHRSGRVGRHRRTSGSGARTAGTPTMQVMRRTMDRFGRAVMELGGFCAAALGPKNPGFSARRIESASGRTPDRGILGSELRERSNVPPRYAPD
jgi:TIR domain-containing protein